jgi:dipeptidyl aminopeptidase/acylaminoacyl peptidase
LARWQVLAALAAGFFCAGAAPLETYGRLPSLEDVQISPDGSSFAYLKTDGDQRYLVIQPVGEKKLLAGFRLGNEKIRSIQWVDEKHMLIEASVTGLHGNTEGAVQEFVLPTLLDIPSGRTYPVRFEPQNLRPENSVWGPAMIRHVDGKSYIYIGGVDFPGQRGEPVLFRIDADSGIGRLVEQGTEATGSWLVDGAGRVVAEQDYDNSSERWAIKILRDDRLTEVASGKAETEHPRLRGLGPDGSEVIVESVENGTKIWRSLSLKDGSWGPTINQGGSPQTIEDPLTGRIIGGVVTDAGSKIVFFDPAMQQHWEATVRAFPGERVTFVSHAADFSKIVLQVNGARDGYVYELVDYKVHRADVIGPVYDGLTDIAEVRAVTYPAADGLKIPAYLTLPPGRAPKNLPLVVLPHGGPAATDTGEFNWWAQALAAQGYAVLQPNYRGSTLSEQFMSAGFGQWGRKMQSDLSDGVRYLASAGFVDPKRVAIEGGSYGGYAALAAAALDPAPYRCAVSVAGIADLPDFLSWVARKHLNEASASERYWDRFMGAPGGDDAILKTVSPMRHVDRIDMPVLLIHGKDDTVVPYDQSYNMANAMKDAHKNVELVTLREEDHWLSRSATRLQMLQASVAFLRKCNPPD